MQPDFQQKIGLLCLDIACLRCLRLQPNDDYSLTVQTRYLPYPVISLQAAMRLSLHRSAAQSQRYYDDVELKDNPATDLIG